MATASVTASSESTGPMLPEDSRGSSVSSSLQDEYEELLKYAVVVPNYNPTSLSNILFHTGEETDGHRRPTAAGNHGLPNQFHNHNHRVDDDDMKADEGIQSARSQTSSGCSSSTRPSRPDTYNQLLENFTGREQVPDTFSTDFHAGRADPEDHMTPDLTPRLQTLDEVDDNYTTTMNPSEQSPQFDQDASRMENQIDNWCLNMKRSLMAEFMQVKMSVMERNKQQLLNERDRYGREVNKLQNEMESLKELLHTYETSIERKDQVISNLTNALQSQKDKFELMRKFSAWKLRHADEMREAFASNLARKFHERYLKQQCWESWHSVIETKWKMRVEKACQAKAQETCLNLTEDYECQIRSLNEALDGARTEVARLTRERERFEETMKKAFMRGVCALNMEAMTMFSEEGEENEAGGGAQSEVGGRQSPVRDLEHATQYPTEPMPYAAHPSHQQHSSARSGPSMPSNITHQSKRTTDEPQPFTIQAQRPVKNVKAKISAKIDTGRRPAGPGSGGERPTPPMSSIVVERHNGASSQQQQQQQPTIVERKVSGSTGGRVQISQPNIVSVKVVD